MRSASTTPRSVRGTDPDAYDQVMGVTSVGSLETVRLGKKNETGREVDQDRVANNSDDLNEKVNPDHEDDSGVGGSSRGYGSASLAEFLNRMGNDLMLPSLLPVPLGKAM